MKKSVSFMLLALCLVFLLAPAAFAEEGAAAAGPDEAKMKYYGIAALALVSQSESQHWVPASARVLVLKGQLRV